MGRKRNRHRPPRKPDRGHSAQVAPSAGDQHTSRHGHARLQDVFPAPDPGTRNRYRILVVCALLLLAVATVFGQTLRHGFVSYDDNEYVYENPQVSHGVSVQGIVGAFTQSHASNWVPLTWISLMVDCQLHGLSPGGYHLTNVLLHAATTVLLCIVLCRMTGRVWPSALVAALFSIHPLRAESVAWVTERKDVLSGLFFMLTLAAYVRYVRRPFSPGRYLLVAFVFALGLMAKQTLVSLPFVLLLLDYWPLHRVHSAAREDTPVLDGRRSRRFAIPWHLVVEKIPLLVLVAVSRLVTLWVQGEALAPNEHLPLWWRMSNALISYVGYLGQFFYPLGLAALYPRPGLALPLWSVCEAFLILASVTVVVFLLRRRCPYLLMGWLWYLGMLLPVIGLVQVGIASMADRFTYLPQIGLCIAVVWAVADLCRSRSCHGRVCGAASVLVLAVLMGCAWRQTCFRATARRSGPIPWLVLRKIVWRTTIMVSSRMRRAESTRRLPISRRRWKSSPTTPRPATTSP